MALARPLSPIRAVVICAVAALACSKARTVQEETPSCTGCHGGEDGGGPARTGLALSAPPRSTRRETATTERRVGAHRQHLQPEAMAVRGAIECRECHVVPTRVTGHFGDTATTFATVTFGGALGRAQLDPGLEPGWNPDAADGPSCSNVYCHGATLGGGSASAPVWTRVDGTQKTCGSCHGYPPPSHSVYATNCFGCHPGTVLPDNLTIAVAGGLHIDGERQGPAGGTGCSGCHEFPPSDALHATHASPPSPTGVVYGDLHTGAGSTAESYDFGCGECHPTTEAAHFVDAGASGPDVDLLPPVPAVAGDDVKRRNDAGAAYDPVAGTCSGVYCHSSGQETPVYATTPDWRNPPASGLGCDGCHGNPPKYESGEAGSATANTHVFLDGYGWESGHFAGMPGAGHQGSKHGGGQHVFAAMHAGTGYWGPDQVASPMTCQTCHFDTVDPTNVLAGRFFYFDTTGLNQLPGGEPLRFDETVDPDSTRSSFDEWRGNQCGHCHVNAPGSPAPAGVGKVLPARHVDGRRDVAFDARTAYAGTAVGLPDLAPDTILRPFYMTVSGTLWPEGLHADAELLTRTPEVLSLHLANAHYDATTKTCSNVACHMASEQLVQDGAADPLVWGSQDPGSSRCGNCHGY